MCREMSTGFFFFFLPVEWVYCSGDGEMSGEREREFSQGEKEYLPTFYENTYLSWPFCYIALEHDLFALAQNSS